MHDQNHIDQAILECRNGNHVAHVTQAWERSRGLNRTVAIRPGTKGKFNLTFSDPKFDLRNPWSGAMSDEIQGVGARQAKRLIQTFLWGQLIHKDDVFDLFINQGERECYILPETATPTRVRIEYEMPNAGTMGSWCHATRLNDLFYVSI